MRNLPEETYRAVLRAAVLPANRIRIGSPLSALSRDTGLTKADFKALEQDRDRSPAKPMRFE